MDYAKESLRLHGEWGGKIEVIAKVPVATKEDLSLAYTPGVAQPCLEIQKDVNKSYELTRRHNLCAVITDGTAVLGLGDIGPEAGMPVMEGKCALFKAFADAENNLQAVCEGEVYFLLQDFGSLVVVLATFAMAEDNVLCTCALYHFCANFACVCAAFFVGTVFCTNSDDAVLQEFANGGEVDEGCADYYFAIGLFCSQHVFEFCGECYAFLQVLVHFPVTCYDFLSHVFCFLLINVFIF